MASWSKIPAEEVVHSASLDEMHEKETYLGIVNEGTRREKFEIM